MKSTEFCQGVEQFNQGEYYACHDTLEALWMEASESDKSFYQGILQIAVACYHLGNYNCRGAIILLGEGIRKLTNYEPDYYHIDVTNLKEMSLNLLVKLQTINSQQPEDLINQIKAKYQTEEIKLPKIILLNNC